MTMMGTTSNGTSFAARSGTATNQQVTVHMTNNSPPKALLRLPADPIVGCGGSDMNSATPQNQGSMRYGATKHGMNTASVDGRREHRQLPRHVDGTITMLDVIAASGGDNVHHSMVATQYCKQDEAHTTTNTDDDAGMAHITCVRPSSRQRRTACGMSTATSHVGTDTADCNKHEI